MWQPDRPGALILSETLPAMIGALAIAGIVLLLLLRDLRRTTTELEDGRARAEHQANHDVLTGLANRAHFNRELGRARGSPGDKSSIALLALDLDRFKQVNDTLGHEAGDQLLKEVGQRLTPLVAGQGHGRPPRRRRVRHHPARHPSAGGGSALSSRIITELSAPFVLAGRVAQIGVSIGVVITPASQAARDLASKADIALYAAKAAGRNTFKVFDDGHAERGRVPQQGRRRHGSRPPAGTARQGGVGAGRPIPAGASSPASGLIAAPPELGQRGMAAGLGK